MKKETFIMAIEAIDKQYRHDIEISKILESAFSECYSANLMYKNHLLSNALFQVLQEEMNDLELCNHGQSWIEWFCWEIDFGRESFRLKAYRKDKSIIKMDNAGDLYDYLMEAK